MASGRKSVESNVGCKYLKSSYPKRTQLGFEHQATKFPRFKDVKSLWKFDYQLEEQTRFKAGGRKPPVQLWDPTHILADHVELYLQQVFETFGKRGGMTEEIALQYLVSKNYNVIQALYDLQRNALEIKQFIMQSAASTAARQECIKYILSL